MAYPNSGALFRNTEKESPKQPDYSGKCEVDGTTYRIAAWIKEGKQGKFLSLAFSLPRGDQPRGRQDDDDKDVPF